MPGLLTLTQSDILIQCIRSKRLHTPSICGHNNFEFGKSRFKIPRYNSTILKFDAVRSGNLSCYFKTPAFQTLPICYKLKSVTFFDEYSVHKINRDNYLMCEVPVTMKYTEQNAACITVIYISSQKEETFFVHFP
jgi:hypothetical protein